MMPTRVNFDYWKNVALIQIWQAATMLYDYDPRAREFGYVPMNSAGDEVDLSDDCHMLVVAVLANELEAMVDGADQVDRGTYVKRASLAAWARSKGFFNLADGLEGQAPPTRPSKVTTGLAATGPKFSMTRHAIVSRHKHQWPTIDADIKEASKNGLSTARVVPRGWDEDIAVAWAASKGKLNQPPAAGVVLPSSMANLPAKKHRMTR